MLQFLFLGLERTGSSILYNMAAGIYSFVARVYDLMLDLAGRGSNAGSIEGFYLGSITTAMYTIAGVFMLFRVTISAINMIINPDMVNDSNKGAGKLLVRIVTSLAMLIIFVPNGWIFGSDGILNRIEKAVLAEDGLISNISIKPLQSTSESENTKRSDLFVDNVNAAGKKYDCYYVMAADNTDYTAAQKNENAGSQTDKVNKNGSCINVKSLHHFILYDSPKGEGAGDKKLCKQQSGVDDCSMWSFSVDTNDPFTAYEGIQLRLKDGFPSTYNCPNHIYKESGFWVAKNGYKKASNWYDSKNKGTYVGGWHSLENMKKALQAKDGCVGVFTGSQAETDKIKEGTGLTNSVALAGVSANAIDFAQGAFGTFINCSSDECDDYKANMLINSSADNAIVDGMTDGTISLDFFPAIIAGIGILIWVLVLCVDVIVRRFKLLLLQMIAPIPIISYSDPNDKMFDQWSKMYIATYLDLFLKLIAISFAIALLEVLWGIMPDRLIEKFFYIIAILVFAKMIPSMLSKIFGLDSLGGSFKDIAGYGKAALGMGAGAVVGGAAGLITGQGVGGKLIGGAAGTLRGAGSGSKGNITGGAKSIAATNALKRQGLNWFDRAKYQGLGAMGIDPNISARHELAQTDQAINQIDNLQKNIDAMDQMIDRTPEVAALNRQITNGVIQDSSGNKQKAFKEAIATAYDKNSTAITFADVANTDSYKKLSAKQQGEFAAEYAKLYGGADAGIAISGGFRAGYMTSKSAAVNALNLLREDKETVDMLRDESISGKREPGGAAEVLLDNEYTTETDYNTFINTIKAKTYGPQGELGNLKARQSQDVAFKDKKYKSGK